MISTFGLIFVWYLIACLLVSKERGETELVAQIFRVMTAFYVCIFAVPVLMQREGAKSYSLLIRLIGPVFGVIMSLVKDGFNDTIYYGFVCMNLFHQVFMT